jgi:hypothetical protein
MEPAAPARGQRALVFRFFSMKQDFVSAVRLLAGVAVLTLIVGCESGPGRRGRPARDGSAEAPLPPLAMEGAAKFFDGQLTANVFLTRGLGGGPGGRGEGGGGGGGKGGGGGNFRGGMGGGRGGMGGGGGRGMRGGDAEDYGGSEAPRRTGNQFGSPMPPVTLHLTLVNNATEGAPVAVEVVDFESDLGNFALKPDHLSIAPGQTGGPESVVSRLGVTSAEIPVKVALRVAGNKETQTVVLRLKATPAANEPAKE